MTLRLCKQGKYWNLSSFRTTKRQQGEVQPSQQLGHSDVLVSASDLDNRFFFSSIYMWKKNEVWTYLSCIWWTVLTTIIVCHLLFWDLWVRITTAVSRGWYPHFFLVFVQDSMNCPGVLWAASHCHSIKNDLDIFPTSSLVALCNVYVRLRIFTDRKQNHDKRRCLCLQSLGLYEVTLHKAMYQGQ